MKKTASKVRDEKLLAAVRDRPVLYDQTMHVFKDYSAKNAAWNEVGAAVVGSQDKQNGQYYYCIIICVFGIRIVGIPIYYQSIFRIIYNNTYLSI